MKWIITIFLIACCATSEAQIYNIPHFKIYYSHLDNKNIKDIADSLEDNYKRIITDLQCPEAVPVKVYFYEDTPAYRLGIKRWVPNPAPWSGGSTLGDSAIYLISPNISAQHYQEGISNVIHEFAHCVSRHINKKIVNNPRWLWESIAIYESRQKFDPRTLPYLVHHNPPALKQLSDFSDTTIYYVGYFIGEYLAATKGKSVLNELIKNNGNIRQTLNMDDEEFTRQWFAFVGKKYGI